MTIIPHSYERARKNSGNVLFYVFMAVGLIAALTYAFLKDSRENFASQNAVNIAESLYAQVNMVRSAVQQCVMEYPEGGEGTCGGSVVACGNAPCSCADLNHDGVIDSTNDNPNIPYPLNPSSTLNPNSRAAATVGTDYVRNLSCVGALPASALMFQGANNQGRFLPPPPPGFPEWTYANTTADGVYIQIIAPGDTAAINAITRLRNKFNTCQAEVNYGGCGARCFTAWLLRMTGAACL